MGWRTIGGQFRWVVKKNLSEEVTFLSLIPEGWEGSSYGKSQGKSILGRGNRMYERCESGMWLEWLRNGSWPLIGAEWKRPLWRWASRGQPASMMLCLDCVLRGTGRPVEVQRKEVPSSGLHYKRSLWLLCMRPFERKVNERYQVAWSRGMSVKVERCWWIQEERGKGQEGLSVVLSFWFEQWVGWWLGRTGGGRWHEVEGVGGVQGSNEKKN